MTVVFSLYPSQIAALATTGNPEFEWRLPQSMRVVGAIPLTWKELQMLATLHDLNVLNRVRSSWAGHNRLGCCGDCEQLLFVSLLETLKILLGIETCRSSIVGDIRGKEEFLGFLAERGYSRAKAEDLVLLIERFVDRTQKFLPTP